MGETIIKIKIKAKGGVIIRIRTVRTIKGMDGGIIRTICHQTEPMNHLMRKGGLRTSPGTNADIPLYFHE